MGFFKRLFGGSPTSAQDHYEQGLACEKKLDHDQALVSFSEAVRLDPNFADAVYARAFVREITGDYDNAIADFEKAAELAPKVGDELVVETDGDNGTARVVRLNVGITYKEGTVEAGTALDIARVCYMRGLTNVDAGDYDKAVADFSECLERSPFGDDPEQPWSPVHPSATYFERGRCYHYTDRFQEAIVDLRKAAALAGPDETFRHFVQLNLGQCFLELQDWGSAIASLTKALEHHAESAEAYANRAYAHAQTGNYDQAIEDNSESLRLDPKCGQTYVDRAFVFAEKKEFAKALGDATAAIRLSPEEAAMHAARASIYQDAGEPAKAIADYNEAIRLAPESPEPYQGRAKACLAVGKKESAAQDERTVRALNNVAEALAEMQQQNWGRALEMLNQAIELDPNLHRAYLRRGMVYLSMQEPDRAIAEFNHIIDKLPKPTLNWGAVFGAYTDAFVNRANANMCKSEFQKAIADYAEAIRLEPKLAPAYEDRAHAYRAIGETEKALRDERRAHELNG